MLSKELMEKKSVTLYKAFNIVPGERLTLNTDSDIFGLTAKAAVADLLQKTPANELEGMVGKTICIISILLGKDIITNVKYDNDLMQDGEYVNARLSAFRNNMHLNEMVLNGFEMKPNSNGDLVFSKIVLDKVKG